jgi:hypothetical protein
VLIQLPEGLGAGLPSEQGHAGARRHGDEPEERQPDADQHSGEHADQECPDDGGDRDPEVEALHLGQAAHLGHVHHPHDDCLDDQGSEHGLGQNREDRRQHQEREQDRHTGGERGQAGARARVVVQ